MSLEDRTYIEELLGGINDPSNQGISQVRMWTFGGGEDVFESLVLFTEFPGRVNVARYSLHISDEEISFKEGKESFRRGNLPRFLYQRLWDLLKRNNIWELKDDESYYTDSQDKRMISVFGAPTYFIYVQNGRRRNEFRVYAPQFDKRLLRYRNIINKISLLSSSAIFKVSNPHKQIRLKRDNL